MMNYGMYGMNPYMMGCTDMMSSGMMAGMFNPAAQINYMHQWDQYSVDRQVNLYRNQNNAQYQMSAQTDGISRQVQILSNKATNNKQNGIQTEYERLLSAVQTAYGSQMVGTADEKRAQAQAYAERIYAQQTGSTLTNDLANNAGGSFLEGFKQVVTFGLGNRTTSQENIAKINGTKLATAETAKKTIGYVAGGATVALGATMLYKYSAPIGKALVTAAKWLVKRA